MTYSFTIKYPRGREGRKLWNTRYGMNAIYAGKHWAARREDAQLWHLQTAAAIRKQIKQPRLLEHPVVIRYWWNDRLDLSNHAYMAKLIEDGMKGVLIKDDSRKYVAGLEHRFHEQDCIRVEVEEIEDD